MGEFEKLIEGLIKETKTAQRGNDNPDDECFFRHELCSLNEILTKVAKAKKEFPFYPLNPRYLGDPMGYIVDITKAIEKWFGD